MHQVARLAGQLSLTLPGQVDGYMNLQLANTEEFIDDKFQGNLGEVLVRCNNVLYVRKAA